MATSHSGGPPPKPPVHPPPPHRPVPVPVDHGPHPPVIAQSGTPVVRRTAVIAARQAAAAATSHPAVWQPWAKLVAQAEQRMRTEVQAALREYEAAASAAQQILDTADAMATEVRTNLQSAAWAEWQKLMDSAARSSDAVLTPAREAFSREMTRAADAYGKALGAAEAAYKRDLAAADKAKADAGTVPAAG